MDTKTAGALIEAIWTIEEKLQAVRRDLNALEMTIADQVEDD